MDGLSLLLERSYDNMIIQIDSIDTILAIQDWACQIQLWLGEFTSFYQE
ncbi:hypothetical protein J1N35_042712 [Gossypium stocksii]|uniref:Uncharacterized protein n=1 Tax=Gossypium stocksii TaxID=47602 RepID=A0A9D3U623_9ROSI|nr:hypothetical protein J1N35_042712 [Gossypium stocksii]